MSKTSFSSAALMLAAVLTVALPASAAERRGDGVRSNHAMPTEFSARRRWRGGYWRGGWRRRAFFPRYRYRRYRGWGYPAYGYYGYPYYWRPRPFFGIGIGFGPRWWW